MKLKINSFRAGNYILTVLNRAEKTILESKHIVLENWKGIIREIQIINP